MVEKLRDSPFQWDKGINLSSCLLTQDHESGKYSHMFLDESPVRQAQKCVF